MTRVWDLLSKNRGLVAAAAARDVSLGHIVQTGWGPLSLSSIGTLLPLGERFEAFLPTPS
jgi:hypothetical protein